MFELTNAQRRCFGLAAVEESWIRLELKAGPYDSYTTVSYLDGTTLRKVVASGENLYSEFEICEQVSQDLQQLLPKTPKGKPVRLSAPAVMKRTGLGMCLSYYRGKTGWTDIWLYSQTSKKNYYSNALEPTKTQEKHYFQDWVENWCRETTGEDVEDVARFARQPGEHVKFREGDVFRFKIGRRLYGYGRILLDYGRMRKQKEPFWDILMGKPLACSAYHIVTPRKDVELETLKRLPSMPSAHMMDNHLFYGEYEIIGNIPIGEGEDYPILYGDSMDVCDAGVCLQCGRLYRKKENEKALYSGFRNHAIGFTMGFPLSVLQDCIRVGSNEPYWAQDNHKVNCDLRNPKFRRELEEICGQFDLLPSHILADLP